MRRAGQKVTGWDWRIRKGKAKCSGGSEGTGQGQRNHRVALSFPTFNRNYFYENDMIV